MNLLTLLGISAIGLTVVSAELGEMHQLYLNATSLDLDLDESLASNQWKFYTSVFEKKYRKREEEVRKDLFYENYQRIKEHNEKYDTGEVSFKLGINQFTDKSNLEAAVTMNGLKVDLGNKLLKSNYFRATGLSLPQYVDWSQIEDGPPVKNQGKCGSCWAFATAGAVEYHWMIKTSNRVVLSEQNLIDCVKDNFGCNGGYISKSFEYMRLNKGIATADQYPYNASVGVCKVTNKTAPIKGYAEIMKGDEKGLLEALSKGPVVVAIDATPRTMFAYESGIYDDPICSSVAVNHGVLVVGYGTTNVTTNGVSELIDFWIIKNSWGTTWGEGGYIRINRKNNLCGVTNQAFMPIC